MEQDDIIYVALLLFSIAFGKVCRGIEDPKTKRNVATVVGFFIVLFVSGTDVWHPLLLISINALIITCLNKDSIPIISFVFSFTYLMFFRSTEYFGIRYPSGHTNLVQMVLTLKLVGLAFDLKDTAKGIAEGRKDPEFEASKIPNPSIPAIFHYSFCYTGVLTGPYMKYRTYLDMLNTPFGKNADCLDHTILRIKYIPLYGIIFVLSNFYFPFNYALSEEFYEERSWFFRLMYSVPLFVQFRMRMYIGMRLAEGGCIMAGMGAYPAACEPKPGKGPTKDFQQLTLVAGDSKIAQTTQYSFETVHNIEPTGTEFSTTVRSAMKTWNMPVQYWLASYVFKRFPIKSLRLLMTFFISALWHGIYAGYYCTICSVPLYLPVEDIYYRNLKDIKLSPVVAYLWWFIAFNWRIFLMGYWGITFRLLTLEASFGYWVSVYFAPTFITIAMYFLSFIIFKKPKRSEVTSGEQQKKD